VAGIGRWRDSSQTGELIIFASINHWHLHQFLSTHCNQVTCSPHERLGTVLSAMVKDRAYQVYVVDHARRIIGVLTLSDAIGVLVSEPPGYFGDFFSVNDARYRS
jgi:CBS-domain-containing membrane protein